MKDVHFYVLSALLGILLSNSNIVNRHFFVSLICVINRLPCLWEGSAQYYARLLRIANLLFWYFYE